jgi:hypothetical protein
VIRREKEWEQGGREEVGRKGEGEGEREEGGERETQCSCMLRISSI